MSKNNSKLDTVYASQGTYKVEDMWVIEGINLIGNKNATTNYLRKQGMPSNLEYVDSFYDSSTGTSGTKITLGR